MSEEKGTSATEVEKVTIAEMEDANTGVAEVEAVAVKEPDMDDTTEDIKTSEEKVEMAPDAESGNIQKTDGEILEKIKTGKKNHFSSIFILSILIALAIVLSIFFYARMNYVERKALRDEWNAQAEEMNLYIEKNVDAAFASLNSLSILTTSAVKRLTEETNNPPGFINIPDIAQTLGEARNTSGSLVIAYMPKVLNENLELWESYSRNHSSWIAEEQLDGPMNVTPGLFEHVWEFTDYDWEDKRKRRLIDESEPSRKLETNRVIERPSDCSGEEKQRRRELVKVDEDGDLMLTYNDDGFDDVMLDDDGTLFPSAQVLADKQDDFYTPVWQLYPVPVLDETDPFVRIINYNLMDRVVFKKAVEYIEISKGPVFLDVCDQTSWFLVDEHRKTLQTAITYPVYDDFSSKKTVVGYYTATIPWKEFFRNQFFENSIDMYIVVRNTCGETFSVRVKGGGDIRVIDEYDAHDPTYDEYERHFTFAEKYNKALRSEIKYEQEICVYSMHMYPTKYSFQ